MTKEKDNAPTTALEPVKADNKPVATEVKKTAVVAPAKRSLVSRRPDSVPIKYNGDVIMLDSRARVSVDPDKLDQKELPYGVTLV